MIGQTKILQDLKRMSQTSFPRFTIICGPQRSGKKLLVKQIEKMLQAQLISNDVKVDTIRQIIDLAYKQTETTIYLIPDADKMSPAAKNALLKVTEEPPRKAYFIMTLADINNTLVTLRSRGTLIHMDPYTPDELLKYAALQGYEINPSEQIVLTNVCTVPGEIDLIMRYDIDEFYSFIQSVVKNIGKVNGANAFKIGQKLSYKEDDPGYDIGLFMRAIMYICREAMREDPDWRYRDSIAKTSQYLSQMSITGVNKSSTIDMWILEMRGIWID